MRQVISGMRAAIARTLTRLAHGPRTRRLAVIGGTVALAALAWVGTGLSQTSPPPVMALANEPLYAASAGDKPVMALALSVEYPTAGAQYLSGPNQAIDQTYSNDKEYIGYYDAESCYRYINTPTETPGAGQTIADYRRFERTGPATSRMCDDAFSGNFLNWATSSAIDMLRLALSGGDRVIDTEDLTVLQRALIPNGSPVCMGNTYVFPAKRLTRLVTGKPNYWGAIPARMATAAGTYDIWIASTLNQIYFGTQLSTTAQDNSTFCSTGKTSYTLKPANATIDPGSNTDAFFYARVRVCESDGNGELLDQRDYQLCTRYPNGKYKPTGAIQKHSDQLRLAAFGYLMDQTQARYGGVLRAPMKYVGNKTFDSAGNENTPATGNPKREWDPQTGIFTLNPEGATDYPISGVINYLNRFGRTGPTPGLYKRYDPVSELYYETLRYLQGLQPKPEAYSNLTPAMYDGFPVYTSWTDPYGDNRSATGSYSCLKSNIIVIGDVNSSADRTTYFPAANNPANNLYTFSDWATVVSKFESGSTASYIDGAGVTRQTSNPNAPTGASARLLGAVAYWAHTHDIRGTGWTSEPTKQRPGLRVNTMLFDVNEMGLENTTSRPLSQNQFFVAAKYGGFNTMSGPEASPKSFNTYGNPFKRDDGTPDNNIWQKLDDPGKASAYYLQSSARDVLKAFDRIFEIASIQAHSIAGAAVKSTRLENGDYFYEGTFDSKDWSGDLSATSIKVTPGVSGGDESVALGAKAWSASEKLAALSAPAATRKIVIGKAGVIDEDGEDGAAALPTAVNFTWSEIGSAAQAALNGVDDLGQQRLNYLRGDRTNDGGAFRNRNKKLLGDIINSGPVYSGAPTPTINSATYPDFVADNKNRTPAVFVGANDGMLHAFNANDGTELFGYIPSWLIPKLASLTDVNYPFRHQSYVDATPAVAEAQLGSAGTSADWATVLVSGTGAGGRGVFALDVTDPAAFGPDKVLWEFTPASDSDIGYVIGQPRIVKLRTSAPNANPATYKWFAMVAGGVNNYVPSDILPHSDTGAPALFLLDLAKPAGTPWKLNSNYYKIVFPADTASGLAPGLANFEVVLGASQEVTKVYAGDLQGNVWKLDFERAGSTQWNLSSLSPFTKDSQAVPLFIAKDKTGRRQPITTAPKPLRGADGASVYVAIGTGKYLEYPDRSTSNMDSFYLVYDGKDATATPTPTPISGRDLLQPGTVDVSASSVSIAPFVWGIPADSSDTSKRAGWYFDLPGTGERQVAPIQVLGNQIWFSTLSPSTVGSTDACGNGNSNSWSYAASIDTGNGTRRVSTIGLLSAPLIVETADSVKVGESDSTGRRIRSSRVYSIQQGSNGAAIGPGQTVRTVVGRLSWRQINNYLDLKK